MTDTAKNAKPFIVLDDRLRILARCESATEAIGLRMYLNAFSGKGHSVSYIPYGEAGRIHALVLDKHGAVIRRTIR